MGKKKIIKCEDCKKHPAAYFLDSWIKGTPPRMICVVCADRMITHTGEYIIKKRLNLREI